MEMVGGDKSNLARSLAEKPHCIFRFVNSHNIFTRLPMQIQYAYAVAVGRCCIEPEFEQNA